MIRTLYLDSAGTLHRDFALEWIIEMRAAPGAAAPDAPPVPTPPPVPGAEGKPSVRGLLWVDLDRPEPKEVLRVAAAFGFHPLAIEDCLHVGQMPKLDDYGDHLFLVAHAAYDKGEKGEEPPKPGPAGHKGFYGSNELEMFLAADTLVTHHAGRIDAVDDLWSRAERDPQHLLRRGPAHLAHMLLDRFADDYRPLLDKLEERLDKLEDEVLNRPNRRTALRIGRAKRDILRIRRTASPERDVVNRLARDPHPLIPADIRPYFRDVYDHLTRVVEETEVFRDLVGGLRDTHLASVANRTNEVVKTLTLFATALLPINIIAGIFGMNFESMPLIKEPWGFWATLAAMLSLAATAAWVFRRSQWL